MTPKVSWPTGSGELPNPGGRAALPRVGTTPINWNNADLPDLAPEVPFPAILDEMVAAGYAGTELGANFPADPDSLRGALKVRGLALCGAYQWLHLLDDAALAAELGHLDRLAELLASSECPNVNVADALSAKRIALAGRVPRDGSAGLADAQWLKLGRNVEAVARRLASRGIRLRYHNHVGSYVETPDEVARLLAITDPDLVDLCFDTGHYAYGGGDPAEFVVEWHHRIGYLHLKDVDPVVLARVRGEGQGFLDALRSYVFCELGAGAVDVARVVKSLLALGYSGWMVLEQDTSRRPATVSARASRQYLRRCCAL